MGKTDSKLLANSVILYYEISARVAVLRNTIKYTPRRNTSSPITTK